MLPGTGKLLAGIFSGAGGTVSAVTGAVGDGVSKLTMDADYVANRKKRAARVKKGGIGTGVTEGYVYMNNFFFFFFFLI